MRAFLVKGTVSTTAVAVEVDATGAMAVVMNAVENRNARARAVSQRLELPPYLNPALVVYHDQVKVEEEQSQEVSLVHAPRRRRRRR